MDENRYHPQQDVFRLIDGKKEPIEPYRFGQGGSKHKDETQKTPKGPYIKSILFDGKNLTTRAVDEKGKEITQKLPAVSGEPRFGGEFDYSKYRQDRWGGPIPEGAYSINPQEVQRPTLKDDLVSAANNVADALSKDPDREPFGKYPGGRESWGDCRIFIQTPAGQKAKTGREKFFIHGGDVPGSAGCIDLLHNDKKFCGFIEKYRGKNQRKVPLTVAYPEDVKDVPDDEFED